MNNDLGAMLLGQQVARKTIENQFSNAIVRRKPSTFKKLLAKVIK